MITIIHRKEEYQLEANITLAEALARLNLLAESYLAVRSGEMVSADDVLVDGDVIKLFALIMGGSEKI